MPELHDWGTGEAPKPPRSFPVDPRPKWHVEPRTLDDLLKRAGPYAVATKLHVEWGAVTAWHMSGKADDALAAAFIPAGVASLSVLLTRAAEEREAGWPTLSDKAATPALYDLPADAQSIARRIAGDVHALWQANDCPYLNTARFKDAYRYLLACVRKGTIPARSDDRRRTAPQFLKETDDRTNCPPSHQGESGSIPDRNTRPQSPRRTETGSG